MDEISLIDNEGNEFKDVSCIPAEKKCIINLDNKIIFSDRKLDETNTFFEVDQKEYVFEIVGDISSFRKMYHFRVLCQINVRARARALWAKSLANP